MLAGFRGVSRRWTASVLAVGFGVAAATYLSLKVAEKVEGAASAIVVFLVLTVVTLPLVARFCRRRGDDGAAKIIVLAYFLKMAAAVAYFFIFKEIYHGGADAFGYAQAGETIADAMSKGAPYELRSVPGTGVVQWLTGVLYSAIGTSMLAACLLYSWLSFWGVLFFYRAFQISFPIGDSRKYLLFVLYLPSLVFWPSTIGKDALLIFALGICCLGAAKILTLELRGYIWLFSGLVISGFIRPHMALLVVVSLVAAYFFRPRTQRSAGRPGARIFGLVVLSAIAVGTLRVFQSFVGVEDGADLVTGSLAVAESRSAYGGSEFASASIASPLGIPRAIVTVLFRPWLFEAGSPLELVVAIEGTLMLLLLVVAISRGIRTKRFGSTAYLIFCTVFVLGFSIGFSSASNFGLLARQRTQVIPILMVFVAVESRKRLGQPDSPVSTPTIIGEPGVISATSGREQRPM